MSNSKQKSTKTIQSLRGMKDIVNGESTLFTCFIENASKVAKNYGFSYLETPLLEETALFKRSVGESSDIVNKEMYQFIDKGENDVYLRPEGTAGVVRHFVEKKLDRTDGNYKWYYYGPMFRYEGPQKGRLREFHQFGCEVFGIDSVYEDANIIIIVKEILDFFGIGFILKLNSLGCKECIPPYKQNLVKRLTSFRDELCENCNRRILTNPIRVLGCKNEKCQSLLVDTPKIANNLCDSCNGDFGKLEEILDFNSISYEIDSNLVRGLDYYNKTAFEFVNNEIGTQSAIAGGRKYDRLVEFLGGKSTAGIGFTIGVERLLELIRMPRVEEDIVYLGTLDEKSLNTIIKTAIKKRKTTRTLVEYAPRSFGKHFGIAKKLGANIVALIEEDELNSGTIYVKNIKAQEQVNKELEEF